MGILDHLPFRSKRSKYLPEVGDFAEPEQQYNGNNKTHTPESRGHREKTRRGLHESRSTTPHAPRLSKLKQSRQASSNLAVRYVAGPTISTRPGFILVGIDFGTTFSGVAWAFSKQPDDISIIMNWDCVDSRNSDNGKTPTKIAYPKRTTDDAQKNSSAQHTSHVEWGYGVEEANAAEWIKLLLLEDTELEEDQRKSPQLQKAREILQEAGKTPVQAVTDYLRQLWQHTILNMKRSLGEDALEGLAFQVVCTVPAVWSTTAVNKMRTAAHEAGITTRRLAGVTTLDFVSEPEAAALATFEDLKARPNIRKGEIFVVCDAGGGTVDLISYKVIGTEPLQLEECVEGSGKLCGAVFLDDDFEKMIAQQLGNAWDVPESVKRGFLSTQWEHGIKRTFEDQDIRWNLQLPHSCITRGAKPTIALDRELIKDTFEHVVSQIRALVSDQISAVEEKEGKLPKGIILVGGFGSCRYIFNVLQRENKYRGIEVLQSTGNKPWTAVCRGAVLRALTNSTLRKTVVQSRILRCNYGTAFDTPFHAECHLESDRYYNKKEGQYYAKNQLYWYLKRGDNMSGTKPVRHTWWNDVPTSISRDSYDVYTSIYTCHARDPPTRITPETTKCCVVESDSPLNITNLPTCIGADGKEYKEVPSILEMKIIGTAVEFAVIYDDKSVGRSQLAADVEDSSPFGSSVEKWSRSESFSLNPPPLKTSKSSGKWDAVALYDYSDADDGNHSFEVGDRLKVTGTLPDKGWVLAEKDGVVKAVPVRYIGPL